MTIIEKGIIEKWPLSNFKLKVSLSRKDTKNKFLEVGFAIELFLAFDR